MDKIIKITLVVFFLLISNIVNAVIEPPFKNIIVNEQPIEYKDILFKDYDGNTINLRDQKGQFYFLNFWATWCTPCLKEIPVFVEFYNQHADQVEILGLDYEPINLSAIDKFIERFSINYPIILFDEKNESEYPKFGDIVGMPTTQIYDPKGELMQTFLGEINIEDLQKIIPI